MILDNCREKYFKNSWCLEIKAKFWRTLIWELFVSSENFSFKWLLLGLFRWSKKASLFTKWCRHAAAWHSLCPSEGLLQRHSSAGYDSSWFPQHRAVTGHTTGSGKRATNVQARDRRSKDHISPAIKNCFWSVFHLIEDFFLIEKSDFSGHCWWCRGYSHGLVSEQRRFLGHTAKAKLPPQRSVRSPRFLASDTHL